MELDKWNVLFEAELIRARRMFPDVEFGLAALTEEVGELAKELMDNPSSCRVLEEAIQVAVVACRIATEGDISHKHEYSYDQYNELFTSSGIKSESVEKDNDYKAIEGGVDRVRIISEYIDRIENHLKIIRVNLDKISGIENETNEIDESGTIII